MDISLNERIVFQNESCLVINKRIGESSEFPGAALFPVHRLDVPVSGCLLLARNLQAATFLGAVFAESGGERAVEKRYWAIVEKEAGIDIPSGDHELVHWLWEDKKTNKSFASPWTETPPSPKERRGKRVPKKAILRYRAAGEGERYFFLEIDLVTGRHHQIRAQLAAQGFHIKGDLKYGAKRSEKGGGIRLHARSLSFPNPLNPPETLRAESLPLPGDPLWAAFIRVEG